MITDNGLIANKGRVPAIGGMVSILSGTASGSLELWLRLLTPPDHGRWASPLFWNPLPVLLMISAIVFAWGFRLLPISKSWSTGLSVTIPLAVCCVFHQWTPASLGFVVGIAFMTEVFSSYGRTWIFVSAMNLVLAVWWFGAAAYATYDYLSPRVAGSQRPHVMELFLVIFLLVGSAFLINVASRKRFRISTKGLAETGIKLR